MADDRILYIEDNLRNRVLVKRVLEIEGYQVFEAEDGTEGFKKGTSETYDLILMDINLPDMDGYQVTKKLRDENVIVPIVALTANAMMGDREKALAAGCDGYISKPVDIDKLPEQVAEYIKIGKEKVAAKPAEKIVQPPTPVSKAPEEPKVKAVPAPSSEKPLSTPEKDTTKVEKPEAIKADTADSQVKKTEVPVPVKPETKDDKAEIKEEKKEPEASKAAATDEKAPEPEKKASEGESKQDKKVNSSETNNVDPLTDTGLVL